MCATVHRHMLLKAGLRLPHTCLGNTLSA